MNINIGTVVIVKYGWKKPAGNCCKGNVTERRCSIREVLPFGKLKVQFYDFDKTDIIEASEIITESKPNASTSRSVFDDPWC